MTKAFEVRKITARNNNGRPPKPFYMVWNTVENSWAHDDEGVLAFGTEDDAYQWIHSYLFVMGEPK